jgi:murein tripeptide amidase MpaA
MSELRFDRFYRYDELTQHLRRMAGSFPGLVEMVGLGKSHEGREIWLLKVTNRDTGSDESKPAFWVDGNIHATEVSASTACLYFLDYLLSRYGEDPAVTRVLDTRVYYVVPRVNPDGAEWALADQPKYVRSSTRPYPYDEEPVSGLKQEDVDGDGRMLMMRIEDPNGPWKVCDEEPRLMVRRDPAEVGGVYYRLLPEGRLENYDGVTISIQPKKEGLDLNRNFPEHWRQEYEQRGAGPYPASEAEVHALVAFITEHPNIVGGVAFHTYSGVILRPYDDRDDKEFPVEDLWTYKSIGEKATALTGYPNVSVFHDFRYHPKQIVTGGFDTWLYEQMGAYAWTVEIWSPQREAGIADYKFIDWYRSHSLKDDLTLLRWSDDVLDGRGYVDWYEYEHPQLGTVELGGWDHIFAFRNPPPAFLEREVARFPEWLVWSLLISPRLELYEAKAIPLGRDAYRVRLVVHNTGWLPSYGTKKALEKKILRGVVCEIEIPDGATLEVGESREVLGQLEGRAYKDAFMSAEDTTDDRVKVEWVVRAPRGGAVKLIARHVRAGTVSTEVVL